jgi:YD repeat-containing protein
VTRTHDATERLTLQTARDVSADPAGERTATAYDMVGRMFRQTRPVGVQTTAISNDHRTDYVYDKLDPGRARRSTRWTTSTQRRCQADGSAASRPPSDACDRRIADGWRRLVCSAAVADEGAGMGDEQFDSELATNTKGNLIGIGVCLVLGLIGVLILAVF